MPVIAIIPAKGTSRRVPGKNMLALAGQPMFGYSVRVAKQANLIDSVIVSSESDAVLKQAEACGAQAMRRPPELCLDTVTNFQVLCHLLENIRKGEVCPTLIVLLQPTTPFRTSKSLDLMVQSMLDQATADSLVTVLPAHRMRGRIENGFWVRDGAVMATQRIQSNPGSYEVTGHVFILRPERTLDKGCLLGDHVLAADLPEDWLDVDVDNPNEWRIAQAIAPEYFAAVQS